MYIYQYVYVYMYTYIHIYIYTYIYIFLCILYRYMNLYIYMYTHSKKSSVCQCLTSNKPISRGLFVLFFNTRKVLPSAYIDSLPGLRCR